MCLAVPARIVTIEGDLAKVDFGSQVNQEVNVALVEAKEGDYVLVHAGYAIQVVDREEAEETLRLWRELLKMEELST
jgi:hydrogenase expression/formation protein HypC